MWILSKNVALSCLPWVALLAASSARAACPKMAGAYELKDAGRTVLLDVVQFECERFETIYRYDGSDEVRRPMIIDGQRRQDLDSEEITIYSTYSWSGSEIVMLQETRWKGEDRRLVGRGRIFLSPAAEWTEQTQFFDEAGASLGETRQTFRKRAI